MPGLDELIGSTYGPFPVPVTQERADAFAAAIGEEQSVGSAEAHPMFASAALFAAAPVFLSDERVVPFTRSLIHSEQGFEWHRPLEVGEVLEVTGTVDGVRARGSLNLVTFSLTAVGSAGPWLDARSVFLLSDEAAAGADDSGEPNEDERPAFDGVVGRLELPEVGAELASLACGASRVDLMKYAAASGDWNPIHYDHDAARSAGLGGVIVHGLLMAAWIGRAAGRYGSLRSMNLRFRNPLRPSVAATVSGSVVGADGEAAEVDLVLAADDTRLVTSRVSVTR